MKRGRCRLTPLMVLLLMATVTLGGPFVATQAQDAPKEAAKRDPVAAKQAADDDMPARIRKLEQTVQRLETDLRMRPLPPPNATGIAIMAQTFAFIGMGIGAIAFIKASKLNKQLEQLRADSGNRNNVSSEGPGLTNG